ncbi:MAG: efflux RND transporter periplasmic adaptor subunit [Thiohalobacterales bacterium]|nr:efflux RND transporter periplasmic adaptor subunit [Thiohalobacterales bacterium]
MNATRLMQCLPPALMAMLSLLTTAVQAADYAAVLDWSQRAVLSTPVSGVIAEVNVRAGERVEPGQTLLRLDQRRFESVLKNREAQQRKFRLQRDEARRELERNRELYARTVISAHDMQVAEIAAATAEAEYASAQAALEVARLDLEYSELRAPFAGIVLDVPVSAGMTVINAEQATPLLVLAQPRPMLARVRAPLESLPELTETGRATVRVDGKNYPVTLAFSDAEPDAEGRYGVAFRFDPGDASLYAGQPAELSSE